MMIVGPLSHRLLATGDLHTSGIPSAIDFIFGGVPPPQQQGQPTQPATGTASNASAKPAIGGVALPAAVPAALPAPAAVPAPQPARPPPPAGPAPPYHTGDPWSFSTTGSASSSGGPYFAPPAPTMQPQTQARNFPMPESQPPRRSGSPWASPPSVVDAPAVAPAVTQPEGSGYAAAAPTTATTPSAGDSEGDSEVTVKPHSEPTAGDWEYCHWAG